MVVVVVTEVVGLIVVVVMRVKSPLNLMKRGVETA